MKKIYTIGTKQEFTYVPLRLFKKNIVTEEHWLIRNVKYIYAENELEAKEKYKNWFFKKHEAITHGWGNWYSYSAGVDIMMEESYIDIVSTTLVLIDKDININYETLRTDMQAENFREWWFSEVKQ